MVLNVNNFPFWLKPICKTALLLLFSGVAFTVCGQTGKGDCKLGPLPSVQFASGSTKLSKTAMALLDAVSQNIKENPVCKVKIMGFGNADKRSQQLSWDHVNAVIRYLVESRGISDERFIFFSGQDGPATSVDMISTTEDGPKMTPSPHPTYQAGAALRRN